MSEKSVSQPAGMGLVDSTRVGYWMRCSDGRRFWPLDPRSSEISVEVIAHALSLQCRFAGHSRAFYSVAQHCVHVADLCEPQDALWGLLHDASEAYLVDVPSPVKLAPEMAPYREIERLVMGEICERFALASVMPTSVAMADQCMLATEARDLMGDPQDWHLPIPPKERRIEPWEPERAAAMFLGSFRRLWR